MNKPTIYYPRTERAQRMAIWAALLIVVFTLGLFLGSQARASESIPAESDWSSNVEPDIKTLIAADFIEQGRQVVRDYKREADRIERRTSRLIAAVWIFIAALWLGVVWWRLRG